MDDWPNAPRRRRSRIGRRLHLDAAQDARGIPPAQVWAFDLNARGARGGLGGLNQFYVDRLQPAAFESRDLARHTVVAEAIGAIDGEVGIEQRPGGSLLQSFDCNAGERQPLAHLLGRERDVHEFLEPIVEDFHRSPAKQRPKTKRDSSSLSSSE